MDCDAVDRCGLEQAQIVGLQIKRPYSDYIDEIERTSIARVSLHGVGVFNDGKVEFHPLNATTLVEFTDGERAPGSGEFRIGTDIDNLARARSRWRLRR
jgi:hypothetical protein